MPPKRGMHGPARSETRSTHGTLLHENREIPMSPAGDGSDGRTGQANRPKPAKSEMGKSDEPMVPMKRPNKTAQAVAEAAEGRGEAEGNATKQNADRTQSRSNPARNELDRVRSRAKRDKEAKFTALLPH